MFCICNIFTYMLMFFIAILYYCTSCLLFIAENFKVVGPAAPLVAEAGEDLVLPCSVKPSISVVDMRVEWFRLHQTDSVVHVYDGYEDSNEYQMESYRGRTALFKEELQKGNTSLKLSALQISDEGAYKCYIESMSWIFLTLILPKAQAYIL
uniref:Ig-like domain-containing protein n=1 Tax=Pygocentrus nattereri TaxID=42514 RepID=A0A3B4DYH2_PYGNA